MRPLVIAPAVNEAAEVEQVLAGIRLNDRGFPVLVINDNSTDDTAEAARCAGPVVLRLPINLDPAA